EILARLLRRDLDVGFYLGELEPVPGTKPGDLNRKIQKKTLTHFSYLVVAPRGWDDRVRGKDWQELAALPWIGTLPASVHNRLLSKIFAARGLTQNVIATVDQELSMLAMVRSGLGLSLCRDSLAFFEKQANGLAIADQVEIETSLSLLSLKAQRSDPRVQMVFEALSKVWTELP
ncbi:MAG: LysR family transcriptional regulator substrate-binding protein, partial [Pseudomonadota bacterium]